jgi:high-affinity iron transporter
MLGAFLLTLREGFEATLLVAIVLAYVSKIGYRDGAVKVWYGVIAAVVVSVAVAGILFATASELEGVAEQVFEGVAMLLAVIFLTYMILWMSRQSSGVARDIREGVDAAVKKGSSLALAALVFTMVLREGIETALFMFGVTQASTPLAVGTGAVAGLAAAAVLGYVVYAGGKRINLSAFFKVTGLLLLVVAAGLLARGVGEFQEAGLIPSLFEPVWNFSQVTLLTSESILGEFLTSFFGWNPSPDLLMVAAWAAYLLAVGYLFLRARAPRGYRGQAESA